MRRLALLLLLSQVGSVPGAPPVLGYQGRLLKADGTPEQGVVSMSFSVFSVETGGTALWAETQSVTMSDGFYATFLGSVTPFPAALFDGSDRWLELAVNGSPLTPRQRIGSVAYALRAADSARLEGLSSSQFDQKTDSLAPTRVAPQGAGSGLDSDTVDGLHAAAFLRAPSCTTGQSLSFDGTAWRCSDLVVAAGPGLALSQGTISLGLCSAGQVWTSTGSSWTCATPSSAGVSGITAGAGLLGGGSSGAVTLSMDPTTVQARVSGTCLPGEYISGINENGTVSCMPDANSGGTITQVAATTGLVGGGTSGAVTVGIDPAYGGFIQNQTTATQNASFNLAGDGALGGSLGIGTSTPQEKLDVAGFIRAGTFGFVGVGQSYQTTPKAFATFGSENHGSTFVGNNLYVDTSALGLYTAVSHSTMSGAGILIPGDNMPLQNAIEFWTTPPASVTVDQPYAQSAPRMIVGANGNVGIGTTAPGQRLSVAGTVESTTGGFKFPDGTVQTTAAGGSPQNLKKIAMLKWFDSYGVSVTVGSAPTWAAFDGDNIWVANGTDNTVSKVRASDNTVLGTYPVSGGPWGVAFDGANIWVTQASANTVTRLRASDGVSLGTFSVQSAPAGVAFDGTNVWVANQNSKSLSVLRASDGSLVRTVTVGTTPWGLAFDGTNMWVTNYSDGTVSKVQASDGTVLGTFPVGSGPAGLAFDGSCLWITVHNQNSVTRMRASDGTVLGTYSVGTGPRGAVFDGSSVWIANKFSYNVTKLRSSDGAVLGTYPAGIEPMAPVFDGANVWITNTSGGTLTKL